MTIRETLEIIDEQSLLEEILSEEMSTTTLKKVVGKAEKGVAMDGIAYKKLLGLKGESDYPDLKQWREKHDTLAGEATVIRRKLLGTGKRALEGMSDSDKAKTALRELASKLTSLKALRRQIDRSIAKAAGRSSSAKKDEVVRKVTKEQEVEKDAKSAEKLDKATEKKRKFKAATKARLANFRG